MKKFLKRTLCIIMATLSLFSVAYAKVGDVISAAYHTDIVVYINNYAIPSYAVNGQSVIVAEDLANFGFDVKWNSAERSLNISRNSASSVSEMTVNKFEKSGTYFSNILSTDIKVYANGKQLTSYALNGYTMIPVEELGMFGEIGWSDSERALKLWVDGLHIRAAMQQPEKSKIGKPIGSSICVDGIGFNVNSADGIKVYWQGKNNTGKTINYYTTYYSMYNPVWDPAYCEIYDTSIVSCKTVGPVKPGEDLIDFTLIAYSSACEYISLDRLFLEYSDGTSEWVEYGYIGGETLWDKYHNPVSGLSIYK